MNKTEFMDLLRYYFRSVSEKDLAEILADYEAHFEEGRQRGLSEEEIAKELGSPKEVYEMYLHEGMIEEKAEPAGGTLADAAEKLAGGAGALAGKAVGQAEVLASRAQETWKSDIGPRVPEAAGRASSLLVKVLVATACTIGFLIILITALAVYLLSGTFPALGGLPPLPGLSLLTLAGLFGTGFFAGLSLFFLGLEIKNYGGRKQGPPSAPISSEKKAEDEKETESGVVPIIPLRKKELRTAEMLAVALGK